MMGNKQFADGHQSPDDTLRSSVPAARHRRDETNPWNEGLSSTKEQMMSDTCSAQEDSLLRPGTCFGEGVDTFPGVLHYSGRKFLSDNLHNNRNLIPACRGKDQ